MKNIKLLVTFGVFGVIPSYLVIIFQKYAFLEKLKVFMSIFFFDQKSQISIKKNIKIIDFHLKIVVKGGKFSLKPRFCIVEVDVWS